MQTNLSSQAFPDGEVSKALGLGSFKALKPKIAKPEMPKPPKLGFQKPKLPKPEGPAAVPSTKRFSAPQGAGRVRKMMPDQSAMHVATGIGNQKKTRGRKPRYPQSIRLTKLG